ncbi:MAG TPA: Uma2 family endonuclease [Hyphomicrobiaceae bacterium]|nr:Uma2 family endonuclease [Hyphomicrobiaceae bacterium]
MIVGGPLASSLGYDLGTKAPIYARLGLPEYWVINANTLATRVFRQPTKRGYKSTRTKSFGRRLEPEHMPELAASLAELGLKAKS